MLKTRNPARGFGVLVGAGAAVSPNMMRTVY